MAKQCRYSVREARRVLAHGLISPGRSQVCNSISISYLEQGEHLKWMVDLQFPEVDGAVAVRVERSENVLGKFGRVAVREEVGVDLLELLHSQLATLRNRNETRQTVLHSYITIIHYTWCVWRFN